MADRFIEQSKEIANNFIQNIVFIDDKAYKNDMTNNAFSALDVSNVFAQSGKICAVYAPKSISDVNSYNTILNKADVVILDWYLDIEKEENQVEDPDADADNDDPRGEFTLKLISDLLSQTGMLKLLIVYTGETDLFEITNSIYQKVDQHSFHKGDCVIQSLNSKILVRAKKQNSETQFAHNPELKDKIVSYESLPTLIVEEFADMTNGLLSNFALSSISAIRNNTSRMLSVFSPKLDPAYLGHKILLENTFESKQLLIKLFGEAISELLETTDIDTKDWVDNWIENRITDETISINGVSIGKSKDLLKKMFSSEQPRLKDKYTEASGKDMSNKDEGKLQSHTIELFAYDGIDVNKSNVDFAILTHHKNIFQPAIGAPILTLGTVIKSVDKYYVCIQQRCDSVRIKEERRFLFLPLEEKGEYPLIVNNELKLFPNKSSFAIKTVKFKPKEGATIIQASKKEDKYVFYSSYGETYEWVVDLKEMQAQRILNSYCAQLSRVGLNESEWLRLIAKQYMSDIFSQTKRSDIMSKISSKDTKPEILVRKFLFSKGFRYRINVKTLPGKPDIVLPKYKTIIFVNGCFWHGHNCKKGKLPSSNTDFWKEKISNNKSRDAKNSDLLVKLGWKVIIIWQCEISKIDNRTKILNKLLEDIKQ